MTNQAKFCDVPDGYVPANRRIYNNLKKPFRWLWEGAAWLFKPFLQACPFAMLASFVLNIFVAVQDGVALDGKLAYDILMVGLVWSVFLGGAFLALKVLRTIWR